MTYIREKDIAEREKAEAEGTEAGAKDKEMSPPMPTLMVVPSNLIKQVYDECKRFAEGYDILAYHGDSRKKYIDGMKMVDGELHQTHSLFSGSQANMRKIIVTSHATMNSRHGPSKLKIWRLKQRDEVASQADALENSMDTRCPHMLEGRFFMVVIDEAHLIKREKGKWAQTMLWLQPHFYLLATATPAINSIQDWAGYLPFLQPRAEPKDLEKTTTDESLNPYIKDSQLDPLCRLDPAVANKHIFKNRNAIAAGAHVKELQKVCTVRRGYATKVNGQACGEALPSLFRRHLQPKFSVEAQKLYKRYSREPTRYLVKRMKNSNKVVWNQKNFRHLVLLTTWLGFEAILEDVKSEHLEEMRKDPNKTLWRWLTKVKAFRESQGDTYDLPKNQNDIVSLLKLLCADSPKLKMLLALVGDEVVTHRENLVLWTMYPAQQIFLWVVLKKLKINAIVITSDMELEERRRLIADFNTEANTSKVIILTYALSATGLNLQFSSHINQHFDVPLSQPIIEQADHRQRRIGAKKHVISYSLSVPNTFNDRQLQNIIAKALPSIVSGLNETLVGVDVATDEFGDLTVEMDVLYCLADGVLTPRDSPMAQAAAVVKNLEIEEFMREVLRIQQGEEVNFDFQEEDEHSDE